MDFFNLSIIQLSMIVIVVSFLIIIICLLVLFIKSREKKQIVEVLKKLDDLRDEKVKPQIKKLEIKKDEFSLKNLLIDKFKPVIEKQLKTKVEIKDFNAKGENFLALVEVSQKKLLLVLDPSGKIIDYKKVK